MKLVCLGGAGAMASSALYDLHKTSNFDNIVVADADEVKAGRIMALMDGDRRFSFVHLDAGNPGFSPVWWMPRSCNSIPGPGIGSTGNEENTSEDCLRLSC